MSRNAFLHGELLVKDTFSFFKINGIVANVRLIIIGLLIYLDIEVLWSLKTNILTYTRFAS